jgi:DNA-binding transcriptional ArsR family regulator
MISVTVGADSLGQLRLATSPLWEAMASVLLLNPDRPAPWPYTAWAESARRALTGRRGADLVRWVHGLRGPVPRFVTPVPTVPTPAMDEALDALSRTPADRLRTELAPAVVGADPFAGRTPDRWLRWLVDAVADYWAAAVLPAWPVVRTAVQEDVLQRAHTLATRGSAALLGQLDGRVRWEEPNLVISGQPGSATLSCDRRLVIVPLLFGRRMLRWVDDGAGVVALSCQARGAAVLGTAPLGTVNRPDKPARGDRLTILVGRGRAAVLRGLTMPTTTSTLANTLGLSASTVSEHLSALVAANVVQRRRVGGRVLYELDRTGTALLGYLDNEG